MKAKLVPELMVNMYAQSATYGEPFGIRLLHPKDGHVVHTFLLHEIGVALSYCSKAAAANIRKQLRKE